MVEKARQSVENNTNAGFVNHPHLVSRVLYSIRQRKCFWVHIARLNEVLAEHYCLI